MCDWILICTSLLSLCRGPQQQCVWAADSAGRSQTDGCVYRLLWAYLFQFLVIIPAPTQRAIMTVFGMSLLCNEWALWPLRMTSITPLRMTSITPLRMTSITPLRVLWPHFTPVSVTHMSSCYGCRATRNGVTVYRHTDVFIRWTLQLKMSLSNLKWLVWFSLALKRWRDSIRHDGSRMIHHS